MAGSGGSVLVRRRMPSVVVIADDLTGAADTGVAFVRGGATAAVVWQPGTMPEADVVVMSTESRQLSRAEAVQRVRAAAVDLGLTRGSGLPWVYKKIDSTLRGHPGPELAALLDVIGTRVALVAPAFPAQGRVTVGGVHLVHGVPLADTPFGSEVTVSDVCACLAVGVSACQLTALRLSAVDDGKMAYGGEACVRTLALVADAQTDADLQRIADRALRDGTRVLCGSAGLAQALAEALSRGGAWEAGGGAAVVNRMFVGRHQAASSHDPSGVGVLVVAASRHPAALRQVAVAEGTGVRAVRPERDWFIGPGSQEAMVDAVEQALVRGPAILTTVGLPDMPGRGPALTERLAGVVAGVIRKGAVAGLVLTGGDAAIAVSRAVGAEALWLGGEVQSGVPWGRLAGGLAPGLPVVTKAGGFGDDGALLAAMRFLERGAWAAVC